ncbi:MAG: 4-alpha-glucanotransferase [Bacteroidaceae bacterium]|nr:4-alpha-glucanotransferase [Bacteroidaceae bacterium]
MTLHFHLPYTCATGETLRVALHTLPAGETLTLPLSASDGVNHTATFHDAAATRVRYRYEVVGPDGTTLRREPTAPRRIEAREDGEALVCCDHWGEDTPEPALLRGAFAAAAFRAVRHEAPTERFVFRLLAPEPPEGYRWAVCGSAESLGRWDERRAVPLVCTAIYCWEAAVGIDAFETGARFKYVLLPQGGGEALWEAGDDRVMADAPYIDGARYLHTDTHARLRLPRWRGAGAVVPVFSLRSSGSQGIGDFGDLYSFVEWAAQCGMRAVQILPINDTTTTGTWTDSYPYSAVRVFALHPLYLDLREWQGSPLWTTERQAEFAALEKPTLDYGAVYKAKTAFMRDLYEAYGADTLRCDDCRAFVAANKRWIRPYAVFSYLRDLHGTCDFKRWGELAEYDAERVARLLETDAAARHGAGYYVYVQYLLHRQMTRVHQCARRLGVVLKGDIPIGVSPCGVGAWAEGRLFHFEGCAGAPPDFFSRHGQNWGFPTYNWEEMARDGYDWWRARFSHMARYFDAYRLDHVLGFFRIWEIPAEQRYGVMGRFRPALPYSRDEIRAAGLLTDADTLCQATCSYDTARQHLSDEEIGTFLQEHQGRLRLKEECANQGRIWWRTRDERQREALCTLCEEVLFIRDAEQPDRFHPRIMGQDTARYKELPEQERHAFDRLHEEFFYHRHNDFWAAGALQKLPAMTGDPMALEAPDDLLLPCAEDLGFVPVCVPGVLAGLHILTLEIQRMPKAPWTRFGNPADYPYLSVCATGTHDMSPLRLWWREDAEQTQAYWHDVLHREGAAPADIDAATCEAVTTQHLDAPSMLCLQALQDWLAVSDTLRAADPATEQINDPANPRHNWSYRLHLTLDTLRADTAFIEKLRGLIARSGR